MLSCIAHRRNKCIIILFISLVEHLSTNYLFDDVISILYYYCNNDFHHLIIFDFFLSINKLRKCNDVKVTDYTRALIVINCFYRNRH